MRRINIIKNIINKALDNNSLIVVYGDTLSKEVFKFDNDNILYLNSKIGPAFIIGLAMCTDKKIVLFCNNDDIVLNFDAFVQISLSKLKNIVCVVFDGIINEDTKQPSLFRMFRSVRGVLFNMGYIVHDYTHFFKNGVESKLKKFFDRVSGPICILIKTSKGVEKELKNVNICLDDNIKRFKGKLNG